VVPRCLVLLFLMTFGMARNAVAVICLGFANCAYSARSRMAHQGNVGRYWESLEGTEQEQLLAVLLFANTPLLRPSSIQFASHDARITMTDGNDQEKDASDKSDVDLSRDNLELILALRKYQAAKGAADERRKGETKRQMLERQIRDPYMREYIEAMNELCGVLVKQKRFAEAEQLTKEAFDLSYAFLYKGDFLFKEVIVNYEQLLSRRERATDLARLVFGENHTYTKESAKGTESMAHTLSTIGNYSDWN